jgi:5'-nucleotidase / UDP-sugar diphosphatase
MRKFYILYWLFLLPFLAFTQNNKASKYPQEIIILHVNDMHGRIDQFPVLSAMIQDIKSKHKNVILVSAGDMFSGNPIVDKYPEKGYPIIDLMNDLHFDVSTFGNHEFDFGPQVLEKRIYEAKFPFIVSNMVTVFPGFPKLKQWTLFTFGKTKVIILGITQVGENGHPDTHPKNYADYTFTDGIQKAKEFSTLSKKGNVFVVLSHMGFEEDSLLATQMPEPNIIIGGHSHKPLQPTREVNNITIVNTGSYLKTLGMLTITLNKNKIISIKDTLLPLKGYFRTDSLILKKVKEYNNNQELAKTVGYIGSPLKGDDELGFFMADAFLRSVKADFSFQNSGGIRVPELPAGPVTVKQIFELDPFSNEIMLCKMTPAQIRELIAYACKKEKRADLISCGISSEIYLNSDHSIDKVNLILPDGSSPDEQKVYVVAINSYVASSYKFSRTGEPVGTGITTTDALLKFLSEIKSVNPSGKTTTKIIYK